MTTELTIDVYESTLTERMINVTELAMPEADIWSYVQELAGQHLLADNVYTNRIIEMAYRNENGSFEHVLLPTASPSVFIIIIIDLLQQKIIGHYRQDLNEIYGLT